MSNIKTISVPNGLGDATPNAVLLGSTFTSNSGVRQTGTYIPSAADVTYDNTNSGLEATNVQDAIDEEKNRATAAENILATNIENLTADALSEAKEYCDKAYENSNLYTDTQISDLINGAPTTLDTLKEVADAMAENKTVVDALDEAIGTKTDQAEYDAHANNKIIHITADERTKWNNKLDKTATAVNSSKLENFTAKQVGESGARNLIPYPYHETTHTENGITWTDNGDGTVTANGTSTGESYFTFVQTSDNLIDHVIDGCTYVFDDGYDGTDCYIFIETRDSDNNRLERYRTNNGSVSFAVDKSKVATISITAYVASGVPLNNVTIKPMLELGSAAHDYVPYHFGGANDADTVDGYHASELISLADESLKNYAQAKLGFTPVQQGGGTNQLNNKVKIGWTGTTLDVQVDATNMGSILMSGTAKSAVLPISRGGTGATNINAVKKNLGIPLTIRAGSTSSTAPTNNGWYKIFEVPTKAWQSFTFNMDIYPNNGVNNLFNPVSVSVSIRMASASMGVPYVYLEHGDPEILKKFYIIQNNDSATDSVEFWYKDNTSYSEVSVTVYNYHKRTADDTMNDITISSTRTTPQDTTTEGKNGIYSFFDQLSYTTIANKAIQLADPHTIDGVSYNGTAGIHHFSTCSTAAATAAKVVSCTGFVLGTGARITVKFTVTNTAANPTLNVNSTGAKAIMYRGSAISAGYLAANRVYEFVYDGTDWELVGDINTDANTTYTTATSSKAGLVKIGYTESGKNYPVELNSSGQMFVNVPWTDNNTTYSNMTAATSSAAGTAGLVPAPAAGAQAKFLRGDGTWQTPTNTDTKATQTNTTTDADYRLVLSTNANNTTETNTLRKSEHFYANPSTGTFYAKGYRKYSLENATLDVNTLTLSAGKPDIMRCKTNTNGGSANITNIPVSGFPFTLDVELYRWASTTDYITKQTFVSSNEKYVEYVRWCTNGTWTGWTKKVFTDNNTDTKVTNTLATTTKAYVTGTTSATTNTGEQVFDTGVYLDTTAGQLVATKFKGALVGNADTATKATKDSAGQQINTTYIKGLSVSGKTITYTKGDNTTGTITTQDTNTTYSNFVKSGSGAKAGLVPAPSTTAGTTKYLREDGTWQVPPNTNTTYSNMTAATASAAGKAGLVPAPAAGAQAKFLRGDGTWQTPTNTTYSNFVKSGSDAKAGLVPAPSTTAGTTKYLREDGTWQVPPNTNTTYSNMTGATSSAAGKAGLVPAPAAGKQASFLRGDGTWVVPTNTTYSNFVKSGSGAKAGLVPAPSTTAGTTKYLREDGTWTVPPNTTYSAATTSAAGLMSAADKTKLNSIPTHVITNTDPGVGSSSSYADNTLIFVYE